MISISLPVFFLSALGLLLVGVAIGSRSVIGVMIRGVKIGMEPWPAPQTHEPPHQRSAVFNLEKLGFERIGSKWEEGIEGKKRSELTLGSAAENTFASVIGMFRSNSGVEGPAFYFFTAFREGGLVLTWNLPHPEVNLKDQWQRGLMTFDPVALLELHRQGVGKFAGQHPIEITAEGRLEATRAFYRSDRAKTLVQRAAMDVLVKRAIIAIGVAAAMSIGWMYFQSVA